MSQFYLSHNRQAMPCVAYPCLLLGLDKPVSREHSRGFSLLELVVVIALLSIVALSATTLIVDNGDLKRQQATETRWNQIHDAIISEPNLYLNGSPYVRGYTADMGRLPVSIFELMNQSETTLTYDEDNDGGATTAEITIDQPDFQDIDLGYTAAAGFESTLSGGWRGPYLYTAGHNEFRDGWGREDADLDQDAFNFGWVIDTNGQEITEVTDLIIQSYGFDQEVGGNEQFTEDFPVDATLAIVSENEWTLSGAPITFNINFSRAVPTAETDLELRIYRYVDDGDNLADGNDLLTIEADGTFDLAVDATTAPAQTVIPDATDLTAVPPFPGTPIGRFAALIWCTTPGPDVVYDGDCDYDAVTNPINHSPVYFTLTNNTSQVTLTWNLP